MSEMDNWLKQILPKVTERQSSATLKAWAEKLVLASDAADPLGHLHGLSWWGYLTLKVFRRGKLLDVIEGKNVIIRDGKVFVLQLLGNVSGAQSIVKMAVGDGGCGTNPFPAETALDTPIPFLVTDTTLRHQLSFSSGPTQNINAGPAVDTPGQFITFVATFNSSLVLPATFGFVPNVVNEAALMSGNNKVLALRAFKSIPFDQASAIELKAEWAIGCT